MAETDWTSIFKIQINTLGRGDSWSLEFDDSIIPDSPNFGWEQYIKNTGARFRCSHCGRSWPSNRVMVIFHMQLRNGQGVVKVRRFRQNCKRCNDAPMERPSIDAGNIQILMESLMEKIRIKCYHENLGRGNRQFNRLDVNSPHEPSHCEACRLGMCTQERFM